MLLNLLRPLHAFLTFLMRVERRFEPWVRPALNALFREPTAQILTLLINRRRVDDGLKLAEEKIDADEASSLDAIISTMAGQMRDNFKPGDFQRGGNTKTHGVVRGRVVIHDGLPENLRYGIFANPVEFPAWVRFSGPGPTVPKDINDVGFASIGIKLMGVPGPKLMDDEQHTQDLIGVCTPTFVTPNTRENAKLQTWSRRNLPIFYFLNPFDSHLLDFLMQGLWNETQRNPLGARYYSCVPYLLGESQAMMYSVRPRTKVPMNIPGLPFWTADNYLRNAMERTLAQQDVEFDIMVQLQSDPHLMPIENAAVRWPEKLSPFIPVATLQIPKQTFDSPAQFDFAKNLSYNPWHCVPQHRPLGNQSRARYRLYSELSRYRQRMNQVPHIEPTGAEIFE